jgi:hypothetical protein
MKSAKSSAKDTTQETPKESVTEPGEETLNQTDLARRFNMSRNVVIERLDEAGIVPVVRGGRGGTRYRVSDVEDVLTLKYAKSDRKLQATERKLEAEAELKEIEVQKRRGELIAVVEVERGAVALFRGLYMAFMGYFADSALEISRLQTRGEVEHYQKQHGGALLQRLREDPNNIIASHSNEKTN